MQADGSSHEQGGSSECAPAGSPPARMSCWLAGERAQNCEKNVQIAAPAPENCV
jgi:hypothetical protein